MSWLNYGPAEIHSAQQWLRINAYATRRDHWLNPDELKYLGRSFRSEDIWPRPVTVHMTYWYDDYARGYVAKPWSPPWEDGHTPLSRAHQKAVIRDRQQTPDELAALQ